MSKELWIKHRSVARWLDPALWDRYLKALKVALEDRLAKLDTNDPMRRKADTAKSEGAFVVAFKPKEDSRWLFGSFESQESRSKSGTSRRLGLGITPSR